MLISFIYWSGSVYKKKPRENYLLKQYTDLTEELLNKVKEIKDRLKVTWYLHFHSSIVLIIASLLRMMIYLRWQQNIPKKMHVVLITFYPCGCYHFSHYRFELWMQISIWHYERRVSGLNWIGLRKYKLNFIPRHLLSFVGSIKTTGFWISISKSLNVFDIYTFSIKKFTLFTRYFCYSCNYRFQYLTAWGRLIKLIR